ncbi:MAG: serine--tRNA ligase [Armatimonadetes bacterium]|nr:serine--tRNA ligase [Armatimonadota bacterium]
MLDRQFIRNNPDAVKAGARKKGIDVPIDAFLKVDADFRALRARLDLQRSELNTASKAIGQLMGQGKKEAAEAEKAHAKALSDSIKEGEGEERDLEQRLRDLELDFPNMPHESVPEGLTADRNVVVRAWGEKPSFEFEPKAHWDLCTALGMIDLERGAKISGSGFVVYRGWGARLQRSLFNYMVDEQTLRQGYEEIYPPYMVNSASLMGTGQLPKFGSELYRADDDLWMIPTAEVPVTNLYRDEILEPWQLPMKFAAFSGCFRREAGAAGKDTRGIQRVHEFDKVELVKYTTPESSYDEHEALTADAEAILQAMGLHYRVVLCCGGEMSATNAKQYDLEVWAPGIGTYLEVSSCSNFVDYQARRANIRFRRGAGEKPEFVHTLNGSGLACPRLFIAIAETYQKPDGAIEIPEPLRGYIGTDMILNP